MSRTVSILIPLYNAQHLIDDTVRKLGDFLAAQDVDHEILFLDDGSSDGTKELLSQRTANDPRIRCFYGEINRGLGASLRKLSQEARGDVLIYCDADLLFGVGVISVLLRAMRDCDCAVASRYVGTQSHAKSLRWLTSRMYYFLCWVLFAIPVADIGSGMVAIKKKALAKLDLKSDGFGIHAELYVKAARQGLLIKEIPGVAVEGRSGSFRITRHAIPVLRETFRLWRDLGACAA